MNAAQVAREIAQVDEMLRLIQDKRASVPRAGKGQRALSLLACLEKRLLGLRRRLLEAALVELLWQYLDHVVGTETGYVVRQLIADVGARG